MKLLHICLHPPTPPTPAATSSLLRGPAMAALHLSPSDRNIKRVLETSDGSPATRVVRVSTQFQGRVSDRKIVGVMKKSRSVSAVPDRRTIAKRRANIQRSAGGRPRRVSRDLFPVLEEAAVQAEALGTPLTRRSSAQLVSYEIHIT